MLKWMGDEVYRNVANAVIAGMNEYGARLETDAKGRVKPGAGVVTGTYRRSLHFSHSGYNFGNDNVKPSNRTKERGGKGSGAALKGDTISIVMGSGMVYAMHLERIFNVVNGAHEAISPQLPKIIEKHASKI